MLKELTVKNFKSFKNETTLSMEADYKRVLEYPEHIVNINDNKLLKIASIYGPNGGGKSNLLKAIMLLKSLIQSQLLPLRLDEYTKCVFSNDNNIDLTAFFVDEDYEIGYSAEFTVIPNNNLDGRVDYLYRMDKNPYIILSEEIVFRRNGEEDFTQFLLRDKTGSIDCKMLSQLSIPLPQIAQSKSIVTKIYEDFANNDYSTIESFEIFKRLYRQIDSICMLDSRFDDMFYEGIHNLKTIELLQQNSNFNSRLITLLKSVDINIDNIAFDEKNIYFERYIDINGEKKLKRLPLSQESRGTQKIFDIFLYLIKNDKKNVIYLFDDMNSYLHPKLSRAIYEWFTSADNKNSQLIFNSHDILNMCKEIFRRDEIWFAYRDENYSTNLIPLSNVVNPYGKQVRNDAVYSKQYLEGKYGADPFIEKGLNWNE